MRILLLALLLSLTACAPTPKPLHDKVFFMAELVDELPNGAYGTAVCTAYNVCNIKILKSEYPYCLTHEIRHGFEGNWHKGYNTTWDCDR